MSRNIFYPTGLIGGSFLFALLYIWSIQPDAKQDTTETSRRVPAQYMAAPPDYYGDMLDERLERLQQQFTAEQASLRRQLEKLQIALQAHIEESKAAQSDAHLAHTSVQTGTEKQRLSD